jgi:Glycine zipper 2TM domain
MFERHMNLAAVILLAGVAAAAVSGCGRTTNDAAASSADAMAATTEPMQGTSAPEDARAAQLAEKERELSAREADLALQERERDLARREAALAAAAKAPASAPKSPAPAKSPAATQRVAMANPAPAAVAKPILVPAGTELSIGLSSDVSTKTAKVGDVIDGRLTSDLVIDGRRVMAAGSPVRGKVTQVVSGSNKIGGVPTLELSFDRVELDDGSSIAISGRVMQQAASDTAKDSAKIIGGAAAGAIVGHQIDHDRGKIIGGLLGGAAGAVVAQKTGGEITLPAGSVLVVATEAPFEVRRG